MPYQTGSERDTAKDYDPMRAAFDGLTAVFEDVKPDSLEAMFFEADTARMEAEAEVKRLTGLLAEATTRLDRLTNATSALLGHSNPYVLPAPHETQWFSTFDQVEFSRALLTRLKETPNA